jgi:uncharacterized RDD family membrane protein YckC
MLPSDKLTIETPEQTSLEFQLAGIGSRALALALDTLLQIAAFAVLGVIAGLVAYARFLPQIGKLWGFAILIFLVFLMQTGYYAFFETIWNGQTPGKRWCHLRVMMESGRSVDAQAAILRNLMRIVDALPTLYAIGIITSLISSKNKRIGDYVAGTVVVQEKPLEANRSLWEVSASQKPTTARTPQLTPGQMQLLESFLDRRAALQDDVRRTMARQVAERLSRGSSAAEEVLNDPEKFLEALAEQNRTTTQFR